MPRSQDGACGKLRPSVASPGILGKKQERAEVEFGAAGVANFGGGVYVIWALPWVQGFQE